MNWTPYDGQLRLHAFSHVASGANSVMYWHWHSIHNSFETYWKGLLSHDMQPNAPYREACTIGADFKRLSEKLVNLKKKNRVAMLVSNEALTALNLFRLPDGKTFYNDVVRWLFDALYEMNVECDMLFPEDENFGDYDVLLVPALYTAPRALLERLKAFVAAGGELVTTFKTAFSDENLKVYPETQPAVLAECLGIAYDEFTVPENVGVCGESLPDSPFSLDGARPPGGRVGPRALRPQVLGQICGDHRKRVRRGPRDVPCDDDVARLPQGGADARFEACRRLGRRAAGTVPADHQERREPGRAERAVLFQLFARGCRAGLPPRGRHRAAQRRVGFARRHAAA